MTTRWQIFGASIQEANEVTVVEWVGFESIDGPPPFFRANVFSQGDEVLNNGEMAVF